MMNTRHAAASALARRRPADRPSRAIFVVDDDEAVRDSLQLLLEADGFEVASFASGAAALAALERARPACLVLDVSMPGMGGLELLDTLAARDIQLPVVMISGNVDRRTRQRALKSGANVVLDKPLSDAELIEAIRDAQAE
jgi:two-component system response regulator FixJ